MDGAVLVVGGAFAVFAVWWWFAPLARQVEAVAGIYEVPLTETNRPLFARAIRWTRRWRVTCAVIVPLCYGLVVRRAPNIAVVAAGIALGSVVAELTRRRSERPNVRSASVQPRRLLNFVGKPTIFATRVAVPLVGAAALVAFANHADDEHTALVAGAAASFGVIAFGLAGHLVKRPFPDVEDDALVEYALRSSSIISVLASAHLALGIATIELTDVPQGFDHGAVLGSVGVALTVAGSAVGMLGASLMYQALPRRGVGATPSLPHTGAAA